MVYVVNDCGKVVACGSRDNNLASACVDMSLRLCLGGIEAGAFKHNVYSKLAPGKLRSLSLGIDCDFLAVNYDVAVFLDRAVLVENSLAALYRVIKSIVALS